MMLIDLLKLILIASYLDDCDEKLSGYRVGVSCALHRLVSTVPCKRSYAERK